MTKKLISIIINCFNGEKYLKKNLNSILKQKYQKYEVIFVDNCSTDSSSKIYKQVKDKRFKYFKTSKKIKLSNEESSLHNYKVSKSNENFQNYQTSSSWY